MKPCLTHASGPGNAVGGQRRLAVNWLYGQANTRRKAAMAKRTARITISWHVEPLKKLRFRRDAVRFIDRLA